MAARTSDGPVSIDVRVRGLDGRLYPATPLTPQERGRAIRLAHRLCHADGWSIRQAQRIMAESHGLRRSVGAISADLRDYLCPACPDVNT